MDPTLSSVVLLALSVTLCTGGNPMSGKCPKVLVLKSFDIDKFLGDWYVIQRFNPKNTCIKVNIKKDDDGAYIITEYSKPLGISFLTIGPLSRTSRKIHFPNIDTEAIFKVHRGIARFSISTYGVVDTDYSNYAVVWGCNNLVWSNVKNADIWSRHLSMDPKTLEAAWLKLKEQDLDIDALKAVSHEQCSDERKKGVINNMHPADN